MDNILILILIVICVYARALRFGLIVDDVKHVQDIKGGILVGNNILDSIRRRFYGAGTLSVGGAVNTRHEYTLSIIINAVIASLSFLAFSLFAPSDVAFFASLLFVLNPVNNQVLIWLNGRRYAVNIILVLLMMLCAPVGILFWLITPMFQVNAIFAPILLGGYYWLLIPLSFLVGRSMIDKFIARSTLQPYHERNVVSLRRAVVIIKSYGWIFFKCLLPGKCMFVYRDLYYWGMRPSGDRDAYAFNGMFYRGLLAVGISLWGVAVLPESLVFLWVFMCLSMLQWSNVITITQTLADRYCSMGCLFMMFFLVSGVYWVADVVGWSPLLAIGVIAGVYYMGLRQVMEQYVDVEHMYNYQIYYDKEGVSARSFMASDLIKIGDVLSAWEVVKQGLRYNPTDFKMLYQCALCLFMMDKVKNRAEIASLLDRAEANVYGGEQKLVELVGKLRGAL